ncbi:transcription termination factor MTEF18, mitochondrial-like [Tasmannia lanceolata]|uniref:transcription termination factor MTEF18, mitochondrial-like n=1 Tax=Tasmannia lanceolata TaxID=3420 RepID=UPI00406453A9
MTHFQKLKTTSILKWVSSDKHLTLSEIPFFLIKRALHTTKASLFEANLIPSSQTLTLISILNWVSSFSSDNNLNLSKIQFSLNRRALHTTKASVLESSPIPSSQTQTLISDTDITDAQSALRDYLHSTRSFQFTDAEYISKNSPNFLRNLIERVENKQEIGRSITRYLRYHPINEFEPFFDSIGLNPSEFNHLLPRKLMFLSDDDLLLENFHFLCNYGFPGCKIGKIYMGETEVFKYEYGVLSSKLKAYEELGMSKTSVIKLIGCSPCLLIGGVNEVFVEVLEELKSLGIECDWIGGCLSEKNSYDWNKVLGLLHMFSKIGCNGEELRALLIRNPEILLDNSGKTTNSLIGLLIKLGVPMIEIRSLLLQFPQVQVGTFIMNLRQGLTLLVEIEMEDKEIQKIVRTHSKILGLCSFKRPTSLLTKLNVGKKRLCRIIQEDPNQLMNWILGTKVSPFPPLPSSYEDQVKSIFLVDLGFVENSNEMKRALKLFRGKSDELQERFDCLVKAGLNSNDVSNIVKNAPHILNQSRDVIEKKIDFLVHGMGYPVESLVSFPSYVAYTIERVKLRYSMYKWLRDEGIASPMLALSTIVASSDKKFVNKYVNNHPKGPEVWEKFKKSLSSG